LQFKQFIFIYFIAEKLISTTAVVKGRIKTYFLSMWDCIINILQIS